MQPQRLGLEPRQGGSYDPMNKNKPDTDFCVLYLYFDEFILIYWMYFNVFYSVNNKIHKIHVFSKKIKYIKYVFHNYDVNPPSEGKLEPFSMPR